MADRKPSPQNQDPLAIDEKARHRGRMGVAPSWQRIPWWGIIIMIAGVIVGHSMLTNTRYLDALYFIFDLPWDRRPLGRQPLQADGEWTIQVVTPLDPGDYSLYAQYLNELNDPVGRSQVFNIRVPEGAPKADLAPIRRTGEQPLTVNTSVPTVAGVAPTGESVVLIDDFSDQPLRVLRRMVVSNGVFLTFRVTFISFAGALVLGLIFGLMRIAPASPDLASGAPRRLLIGAALALVLVVVNPGWRGLTTGILVFTSVEAVMFLLPAMPYTIATLYVEVIRGIPMLVIVLYMGFAITPTLRDASRAWGLGTIDLRGLPAATIALAFGYGAYLAEVYRAGIESIPRGQVEAARSLGMTYFQAMRLVILPQAIRVVLPPLGNDFIALLKDTSLISVIALPEILQQGRLWISRNFRAFEGYNSVAMLYLILTLILSLLVRVIERRTSIEQ